MMIIRSGNQKAKHNHYGYEDAREKVSAKVVKAARREKAFECEPVRGIELETRQYQRNCPDESYGNLKVTENLIIITSYMM
jgi:hypothetical protein